MFPLKVTKLATALLAVAVVLLGSASVGRVPATASVRPTTAPRDPPLPSEMKLLSMFCAVGRVGLLGPSLFSASEAALRIADSVYVPVVGPPPPPVTEIV